jgi:hypothetical protein
MDMEFGESGAQPITFSTLPLSVVRRCTVISDVDETECRKIKK